MQETGFLKQVPRFLRQVPRSVIDRSQIRGSRRWPWALRVLEAVQGRKQSRQAETTPDATDMSSARSETWTHPWQPACLSGWSVHSSCCRLLLAPLLLCQRPGRDVGYLPSSEQPPRGSSSPAARPQTSRASIDNEIRSPRISPAKPR
eukprot:SAG31_NODE_5103_length_2742_cov_5.165721_4_plen_148_part_00